MYIIIVGCGKVGGKLAKLLAGTGHNVVVIDNDALAFQKLGVDFNGLTIKGDGFDVDLLKEAGIEQADAFCAVTGNDNVNIMSCQVAKKIFHIPKVITQINDTQYMHVYEELGIDIVSSTSLLASMIRNKIIESRSSSLLLQDNRVDVLEIAVGPKISGKRVEELNLPAELVIVAKAAKVASSPGKKQVHQNNLAIVRLKDRVAQGEVLIGVVKTDSLAKVKKLLGLT